MKYRRSAKLYFNKWLTSRKTQEIRELLKEFARLQNYFAENYENEVPHRSKFSFLTKEIVHKCMEDTGTFCPYGMVQQAIMDAYGQIKSAHSNAEHKNGYHRPTFSAKRMLLNDYSVALEEVKTLKGFDLVLKLRGFRTDRGYGYKIWVPLKKHKVYNYWNNYKDEFNPSGGKRSSSLFVTDKYVQVFWTFESGDKKEEGDMLGIDFGMHNLLTLSNGEYLGGNILSLVEELRRKKYYSKGFYRKKAEIKEYLDICAKSLSYDTLKLIVIEDLRGIKQGCRGRLRKNVRSVLYNISTWQLRERIQQLCEKNRVAFRRMPPYYTSQECLRCGHIEKGNRKDRDTFECLKCGHSSDADLNASRIILKRFTMGKYGSHYQQEFTEVYLPQFLSD